jgi:hypothetical protein
MLPLLQVTPPEPDRLNDPKHWREKAHEARRQFDAMKDPVARATMQRVVEAYEGMALASEKTMSNHLQTMLLTVRVEK